MSSIAIIKFIANQHIQMYSELNNDSNKNKVIDNLISIISEYPNDVHSDTLCEIIKLLVDNSLCKQLDTLLKMIHDNNYHKDSEFVELFITTSGITKDNIDMVKHIVIKHILSFTVDEPKWIPHFLSIMKMVEL